MSPLDSSDAHRSADYLRQAERGETSGATDQGPGCPTATDDTAPDTAADREDPGEHVT